MAQIKDTAELEYIGRCPICNKDLKPIEELVDTDNVVCNDDYGCGHCEEGFKANDSRIKWIANSIRYNLAL